MLKEALIANSVCQNSTRAEPLDKAQTKSLAFHTLRLPHKLGFGAGNGVKAVKLLLDSWTSRCSCSGQQFHPLNLPEDPLKAEPSAAAAGRMKRCN